MENNNTKKKSKEKSQKGSNSCVLDLSLDNGNGSEENELIVKNEIENNIISLNKSFDDIKNFTKKLNLKDNFENVLDLVEKEILSDNEYNNNVSKTRSKTFRVKSQKKNSPIPKPIEIDEYIKPLRLNSHKSIIRESSQKDLIDCKSFDDKSDTSQNYLNYFSNKEEDTDEENKNALKINKIKNKNEIKFFKSNINCKYYNEFENILNIEKIFLKNINSQDNILIGNNKNIQNSKKRQFWHKHINVFKKQMKSYKKLEQKEETFGIKIKKSDTFSKNNNYEGLFILGVLESAAKEKKRRKTIQNKKLNKNDEDEK
jgi:hypothetical protein